MADKIVTDDILQKATEGIIQLIADNIFEFESYNDTEIAELFSLTPEESQHISDLILVTSVVKVSKPVLACTILLSIVSLS